jgi:hypothetical protein
VLKVGIEGENETGTLRRLSEKDGKHELRLLNRKLLVHFDSSDINVVVGL